MDKKKRKRKIESLEKRIKEHKKKILEYKGKNYALVDYWEKEIKRIEKGVDKEKQKLKK